MPVQNKNKPREIRMLPPSLKLLYVFRVEGYKGLIKIFTFLYDSFDKQMNKL